MNAYDLCSNHWSRALGGNYWSDYKKKGGYDNDGDGIGDVPYTILPDNDENDNFDEHPLMEPVDIYNVEI